MSAAAFILVTIVATQPATSQPTTRPSTQPATAPTTQPSEAAKIGAIVHGGAGHWCQLCAAAAARKAEAGEREKAPDLNDPPADLMSDLPPR